MASFLLWSLTVYAALGLLVGAAFVFSGVAKVDPRAAGGSWGFRLAILPGSVALWPWVLRRWAAGGPPPEERNAHRAGARGQGT